MRALLAVAAVSTGCFATQRPVVPPSTVASATVSTAHARVGCIAIDMTRTERAPKPVLTYAFTNTCDREARYDSSYHELQTVVVEPDGNWTRLIPVQRQINWKGYRLDPHETTVAERAFAGGGLPSNAKICTDLGGADPRIAYQPRWACVAY